MLKILNMLGIRKENQFDPKAIGVIFPGKKNQNVCDKCSKIVDSTYKYTNLPVGNKVVPMVLVAVCDNCENVVDIPKDTEKQVDEFIKNKANEPFGISQYPSVDIKNTDDDSETEIAESVMQDNAHDDFKDAFSSDVLNGVGKGNVSIITASNVSEEDFQDNMRKKKDIETTLWVNWLKSRSGLIVPCSDYIVISNKWDEKETKKEAVTELLQKISELSDFEKVSILMVKVIK